MVPVTPQSPLSFDQPRFSAQLEAEERALILEELNILADVRAYLSGRPPQGRTAGYSQDLLDLRGVGKDGR